MYEGSLSGTTQITFDSSNSRASFSALQVTSYGIYVIRYHVTTIPAEYDFYVEHTVIARGQHHITMPMNETAEIKLKLKENYQMVVGGESNYVAAYLGDWFSHLFPDVQVLSSSVSPGKSTVIMRGFLLKSYISLYLCEKN